LYYIRKDKILLIEEVVYNVSRFIKRLFKAYFVESERILNGMASQSLESGEPLFMFINLWLLLMLN